MNIKTRLINFRQVCDCAGPFCCTFGVCLVPFKDFAGLLHFASALELVPPADSTLVACRSAAVVILRRLCIECARAKWVPRTVAKLVERVLRSRPARRQHDAEVREGHAAGFARPRGTLKGGATTADVHRSRHFVLFLCGRRI
jgi:hypothetical protein